MKASEIKREGLLWLDRRTELTQEQKDTALDLLIYLVGTADLIDLHQITPTNKDRLTTYL